MNEVDQIGQNGPKWIELDRMNPIDPNEPKGPKWTEIEQIGHFWTEWIELD